MLEMNELIDGVVEFPEITEAKLRRVIRGNDTMLALSLCLALKERGYWDIAERNLILLQRTYPEEPAVSYELGVLLARTKPEQAELAFLRALKLAPSFESAFRCLAMLYLSLNRIEDFTALIEAQAHAQIIPLSHLIELARLHAYIDQLPPSSSLGERSYMNAAGYGIGPGGALVGVAFNEALAAVENRQPFALVRLGDGEGALWRFDPREEMANFAEYWSYRDYFSMRWYGQSYGHAGASLLPIQAALRDLLPTADIVAAPTKDWILHEGASGNIRTFICCVNAARAAHAASTPRARTSVHFDLLDSGGLSQIISASKRVCVVTSHRAMIPLMEERFPSVGEIEVIIIPPAFSDLNVTNYSLGQRIYEVVDQLVAAANTLGRDHLILVGGGFIGKLICLRLKILGFTAIDVGSVFDLVLDLPTRPNFSLYDAKQKFREGVVFVEPIPI